MDSVIAAEEEVWFFDFLDAHLDDAKTSDGRQKWAYYEERMIRKCIRHFGAQLFASGCEERSFMVYAFCEVVEGCRNGDAN